MISSAVVIPEQPPSRVPPAEQTEPSSPSLKRRQSSFSLETDKRPRLDTYAINGSATLDYGSAQSPPPSASASSPPLRKSSTLPTGAEEKKRGRRLFGGLLSTLSQTASKPGSAQRKREDIEKRQLDRLKAQNEEREEDRRRRRDALVETRGAEQKRWDEESKRIRWANKRAMAGSLRTETEPRLYYKPWELREEEKARIGRQKEEVEEEIRRETEGSEEMAAAAAREDSPCSKIEQANGGFNGESNADMGMLNGDAQEGKPETDAQTSDASDPMEVKSDEVKDTPPAEDEEKGKPKHDEHEHHGEELVQGQEDDVIY